MKMVKLIIEVSDELLEHIDEPCNDEDLLRYIIKHGTPLPEHYGDLIERSAIPYECDDYSDYCCRRKHPCNECDHHVTTEKKISAVPTIIPATNTQKQTLFDKMEEAFGKEWDASKQIEKSCMTCGHCIAVGDGWHQCDVGKVCGAHSEWTPNQTATKEGE